MKPVMAVIVASAVLLAPNARPAAARMAEGSVNSLSIIPTSGKAEVVIGVAGGFEVADFTLRGPDRIVLDLAGASLKLGQRGYDHVARGGIVDVRYSNFKKGTVRVVLYLDAPRSYQVSKADGEVRVAVTVPVGSQFAAWHIGGGAAPAPAPQQKEAQPDTRVAKELKSGPGSAANRPAAPPAGEVSDAPVRTAFQGDPQSASQIAQQSQQPSQQPRISVIFPGTDIHDVIASFAAFSGRTILPSNNVTAIKVEAEIKDQPWDVALQAILAAQGLAAQQDANGIIIVDTQERIAARAETEQLVTKNVRLNYQKAQSVADQIRQRLLQCIPAASANPSNAASAANPPAGQPPAATPTTPNVQPTTTPQAATPVRPSTGDGQAQGVCRGRGSVSFDDATNSITITAPISAVDDLVAIATSLDLRQAAVNIKAKIVLVNRTDLDALGIKYDLGARNQFFSQVIQRVDSAGNPGSANDPPLVLLGGNTVSAIANASGNVPGAALRLIYSTAIGNFDFSTFLDALQEVNLLDVQSEPSVTTLNNVQAELVSGDQVPFVPLVSSGGAGTSLTGPVTVERIQTGVTLRVTPSVTNNRQITMQVQVINSDVSFTNNGTLIGNNSATTSLLVPDGQTVVIGGLTQTSVRVTKSGIPLLVDLPLIGRLFGYTTRQEQRRDLLIMITPHIVDEGQQPSAPVRP
ncbi:MAG: AMIN domain-containing protein [Gemmatimonadota bacterium]